MCSKYATITIHHSTTDSQTRPAHLKDPQSLGPVLVRKQPTRPWSLPGPCGIQKTNMGHQPAGGSSSWCPELEIPNHAPIDLVVRRELGRSVRRRCPGPGGATWPSVRQSLYWHPLSIYIETPTKGRWGCSRMTVSPTASATDGGVEDQEERQIRELGAVGCGRCVHHRFTINLAVGVTVILLTSPPHPY